MPYVHMVFGATTAMSSWYPDLHGSIQAILSVQTPHNVRYEVLRAVLLYIQGFRDIDIDTDIDLLHPYCYIYNTGLVQFA